MAKKKNKTSSYKTSYSKRSTSKENKGSQTKSAKKNTKKDAKKKTFFKKAVTKTTSERPDYEEVVYVGLADHATRKGSQTGKTYVFQRDKFGQPAPTKVHEDDVQALLAEKGKGCVRKKPQAVFMTKSAWDVIA